MANQKLAATKVAAKWAVINFVISVVLIFAFQVLALDPNSPARYVSMLPFIAFLFLSQKEYRDELGGFIKFGDAFLAGLFYAIISGVLSSIFTYLYYAFLSPQAWSQVLTAMQTKLVEQGSLSSDKIDATMAMYGKFGVLITAVSILFATPIMGVIISLIGAAIFKKERTIQDIESEA